MQAPLTVSIQAKVAWHVSQSAPNRWIAVCEELNVVTEGSSLDEIHDLIPETMGLLFGDLLTDSELDSYLRQKGWQTTTPLPHDAHDVEFDLPFQMITEGGRDFEHRPH